MTTWKTNDGHRIEQVTEDRGDGPEPMLVVYCPDGHRIGSYATLGEVERVIDLMGLDIEPQS